MAPKALIIIIALTMIGGAALLLIDHFTKMGSVMITTPLIRFLVSVGLGIALIRGWNWARWVAIVLLAVSVIVSFFLCCLILSQIRGSSDAYFLLIVIFIFAVQVSCLIGLSGKTATLHFAGDPDAEQDGGGQAATRSEST